MTTQHSTASLEQRQRQAAEFMARLQASPPIPVLDGAKPIDRDAVAGLALERSRMGAWWLARVVQPDGAFPYVYDPGADAYDTARYNEVRHAGTTYALFQACELAVDSSVPDAAEAAASYIANATVSTPDDGGTYASEGKA